MKESWYVGTLKCRYCAMYQHLIHACLCGLAQLFGVPHLPQCLPQCHVPITNPILLSTSLSDPSCVSMIPPRYTKFSVCPNSCPFPPSKTSCFSLLKIGILSSVCLSSCPFLDSPALLLSASSAIHCRYVENCVLYIWYYIYINIRLFNCKGGHTHNDADFNG